MTAATTTELKEIAKAARATASKIGPFKDRIDKLLKVVEEIGLSWSGSYLGYQSCCYYQELMPKPHGAYFDMAWGTMDRFANGTRGDWVEYDFRDIYDHLDSHDTDLIPSLNEVLKVGIQEFCRYQDEALSILEIESDPNDSYFVKAKTNIDQLKLKTQNQNASKFFPNGGSVRTLDLRAMQEQFRLPPHITYQSELDFAQQPSRLLTLLADYCESLARHIERKESRKMRRMEENMGKKIFIGHGRSMAWRDLKDFLHEKLGLEYDEFNRQPTAGFTTIERLERMLDDAGMAFLVLTGEDEDSEGRTQARQNCIHEVGLFQGRLGFRRAIILLEDDCEEFSNIAGLSQIRFPKGDINSKREEIRETLVREGFI